MVPLGTKAFFAFAVAAAVAAIAYGVATNDGSGGAALTFVAIGAAGLGLVVLFAGGDHAPYVAPDAVAAEQPAVGGRPEAPSPWPLLGALGLGVLVLGVATNAILLGTAAIVLAAVGTAWLFQHWTEQPTYSAVYGRRLKERFAVPVGLPLAVILLVATIVLSLSRVFLALPENGTRIVALIVAVVILFGGFAVASSQRMARTALGLLIGVALVAVVTAGGVSVTHGARRFEQPKLTSKPFVPAPGERSSVTTAAPTTTTP